MAPQDPYPPHPDPTASTIDTPPEPKRPGMLASRADTDTPAWPVPTARPLGLGHGSGGPIQLAFLGRTSTVEHQDPTLSIPRQHHSSQAALPAGATIVCNFYDVESGRKDLDERGLSRAHEQFDIPLRRDGGLNDLLAEATRPDRRFDAVICESIDRVARLTYYGTRIEHELQRAGVLLLAADEPRGGKYSTTLLTRRVKQAIAEWYVTQMLEASRDGLIEHTKQGYNIGRPPYGYLADRIPHPVPAKRAEGKTKSRLIIDPDRAPAVAQIFTWRISEQLGYKTIAKRLNRDPDRYPPPIPNRPAAAKGGWAEAAVADLLRNPKYTGYMVWNRMGENTTRRQSRLEDWIWSPEPTHQAIVSLQVWGQAQHIGHQHHGSRDGASPNRHPHTKHTYVLRSHVRCVHCGRRLCGRTITHRNRQGVVTSRNAYYRCPLPEADGELLSRRYPDHPPSVYVREDYLLDGILDFFTERVFHPDRRARLGEHLRHLDQTARQHLQRQQAGLQRAIDDLDIRKRRLIRALALNDSLDRNDDQATLVVNELRQNLQALDQQRQAKLQDLAALTTEQDQADALELLDALPIAASSLPELPEPTLRRLFGAYQLQVDYDRNANWATVRVTLRRDAIAELQAAAHQALLPTDQPAGTQGPNIPVQGAQTTTVTHALVVPPEMAVATPAATMASSRRPVVASSVPPSIRSARASRLLEKVLIVTSGPSGAIGGNTAWNRWPPGSRASTHGRASSMRRPSGATTRCTRVARAAAEASRTAVSSRRPCRSTHTSCGPFTSTSVTVGSESSGASGPRPVSSSVTARTVAAKVAAGSTRPSSRRAAETAIWRSPVAASEYPLDHSRR
jgi:site-specific DNA recombinase